MSKGYSSWEYKLVYSENPELSHHGFLTRQISGTQYKDRISYYPFLSRPIDSWDLFAEDEITTTIITNPLRDEYFPVDRRIEHYKNHSVVDLLSYKTSNLPENHRRNIKKSTDKVKVTPLVIGDTLDALTWLIDSMYQNLVKRHEIKDNSWTNYSKKQIKQLLTVPGAILFQSSTDTAGAYPVGYSLFFIDGDDVYYHLSCQSEEGYRLNSNYVMMDTAIKFFKQLGLRHLEIGATPDGAVGDGLKRFKEGFQSFSAPNCIIKLIHNSEVYESLSKDKTTNMFPKYRFN